MALAPLEPRLYGNGEEAKWELAIADKRLKFADEGKLKECLRFCFMLVGLRDKNLPDDIEKAFLISFIREHYGGHTASEIRLAFEMAITGKLPVEANCYENFSAAYFAGIMNAYRRWAVEQARRLERISPPPVPKPDPVDINIEYAVYLFSLVNKLPCKR